MARRRSRREIQDQPQSRVKQLPLRRVSNRFPPICALSEDEVEFIHESSLDVLEQIGIEVMSPAGRELLLKAGAEADKDDGQIFIDRGLVEECFKNGQTQFSNART